MSTLEKDIDFDVHYMCGRMRWHAQGLALAPIRRYSCVFCSLGVSIVGDVGRRDGISMV